MDKKALWKANSPDSVIVLRDIHEVSVQLPNAAIRKHWSSSAVYPSQKGQSRMWERLFNIQSFSQGFWVYSHTSWEGM